MFDKNTNLNVISKLDSKRRDFLKSLIAAGFATPLVATFSIDTLTAESASAQSAANCANACNTCPGDTGYVGPGSFQAHLAGTTFLVPPPSTGPIPVAAPVKFSSYRVNGEATFTVDGVSFATGIATTLLLVAGATVAKAYLVVSGMEIPFSSTTGVMTPSTASKLCDLDDVLNAMASGQATAFVQGTYMSSPFLISGPVQPGAVSNPVSLLP